MTDVGHRSTPMQLRNVETCPLLRWSLTMVSEPLVEGGIGDVDIMRDKRCKFHRICLPDGTLIQPSYNNNE